MSHRDVKTPIRNAAGSSAQRGGRGRPSVDHVPNDAFVATKYRVGIFHTVSEPFRIAIDIDAAAASHVHGEDICLGGRLYIYRKTWTFLGPKKALYAAIMCKLMTAEIKPVGGIAERFNPNNRSMFDLPDEAFEAIDNIIGVIVDTLATSDVVVNNNDGSPTVESALNHGTLMAFGREPTAMILPAVAIGGPSNRATILSFRQGAQTRPDAGTAVREASAGAV